MQKSITTIIMTILISGCGNSSNSESKSISTNQKALNTAMMWLH
jgi:hypothetical protein